MNNKEKKAFLFILDGWGHGKIPEVSAINAANTPFMDELYRNYPNAELTTFGPDVGLPEGQMGNSEVGHLNIGAGRIVYQELVRIHKAIEDKVLHNHESILNAAKYARENDKKIHLLGLVSNGGVHSHIDHLLALCDIFEENGCRKVYIHAFTDGRDCDPNSGLGFITQTQNHIKDLHSEIASIIGRYYAMDRDNRWERIKLAYDALVHGEGIQSENLLESIKKSYKNGVTDEFIKPIIHIDTDGKPVATIEEGDVVFSFNFRTDRPRQITKALTQEDNLDYNMQKLTLRLLCMTNYDDTFKNTAVIFEKENLTNTLGESLQNMGKTQLRIAETEKYPHVTYFFSGGREEKFSGEDRILIPSPKVPTYDLQPEMSAFLIRDAVVDYIESGGADFICLNFANTDMVGHTGVFDAAKTAAEAVDQCLSKIIPVALEHDYEILIIADHGNSDLMINPDGSPHTAHTLNPVPVIYVSNRNDIKQIQLNKGKLADVAPTLLSMMGLEKVKEMTGESLIK